VLVILLKQDAATDDDVNAIRDQLSGVQQSATTAAQRSVQSVDQRLTDLEGQVSRLSADQRTTKRELQVVQDDIKELRSSSSGAKAGGALGTP
jgi:septal ring factor EnvC (AmiA/AmiB activator)